MEVISCASSNIWKEKNDQIFKGTTPSIERWKVRFKSDLHLHTFGQLPFSLFWTGSYLFFAIVWFLFL
jgi:hypothetical protein